MPLPARLLRREVLPFLASFAALALASLAIDRLLHAFGLLWVGRWLGIPGTLLILGSTVYSLRKRKRIPWGNPARLLRWHEVLAWLGSLLVLVHAGVHFNALLGWLAVWAMLINVCSGLTGKFLLGRARRRMEEARRQQEEAQREDRPGTAPIDPDAREEPRQQRSRGEDGERPADHNVGLVHVLLDDVGHHREGCAERDEATEPRDHDAGEGDALR